MPRYVKTMPRHIYIHSHLLWFISINCGSLSTWNLCNKYCKCIQFRLDILTLYLYWLGKVHTPSQAIISGNECIWCQWCCQWCHCIHLGYSNLNKVKCDFSVTWYCWYQHCCHMMLTPSSMAPLFHWKKLKQGVTWLYWSWDVVSTSARITWH